MKKTISVIAACVLLCACTVNIVRGSGKLVTEAREVRGFHRVSLADSGEVILTQGERESLTVETDDNVMPHVVTEVQNGTLTLRTKIGMSISPTRLRFTLTVKDLDAITVSGSGNLHAERLETDSIEIEVTGSGDVRIDALEADEADVRLTGSGGADLAGEVRAQEVNVSGSGSYQAGDLRSVKATAKTSGSGSATLWVTESLDARTSGSGSVHYYGDPSVNASSTGSGDVKRLGEK